MNKSLLWAVVIVIVICLLGGYVVFSTGLLDPYHSFYGKWKVTYDGTESETNSMMSQINEIAPNIYFTFSQERDWTMTINGSGYELNIYGTYNVNDTAITLMINEGQEYSGSQAYSYCFTNRENTLTLTGTLGYQIILIRVGG